MKSHSTLAALKKSKCLVCALLSAREKDPEKILGSMEMAVRAAGGINVGRLAVFFKGEAHPGLTGPAEPDGWISH